MSLSGTKITNQVTDMTRKLRGGIYTAPHVSTSGLAGQQTAAFPRGGLSADSSQDEMMRMKMEFAKNNAQSPFGDVYASDSDFKWLQKKRETEAAANFDAWESENFHTDDVVTRKWLQDVDPDFYKVREQEMTDKAKLALQINLILLHGPKTMKDLILIWGLQTGRIVLDRDWNVIGPSKVGAGGVDGVNMAVEQGRYQRNLMRPSRYPSDADRGTASKFGAGTAQANPFRVKNDAQRQIASPFAGYAVPQKQRYPNFLAESLQAYL